MHNEWCVLTKRKKIGLCVVFGCIPLFAKKERQRLSQKEKRTEQSWLLCCLFGVELCPTHVLFSSSPVCQISLYSTSQTPLTNQSKDIYDDMARRHIPNFHGITSSLILTVYRSYMVHA